MNVNRLTQSLKNISNFQLHVRTCPSVKVTWKIDVHITLDRITVQCPTWVLYGHILIKVDLVKLKM